MSTEYRSDREARKAGFCNANCRNGYVTDRRYGAIYTAGAGFRTWRETARAWQECAYCRADISPAEIERRRARSPGMSVPLAPRPSGEGWRKVPSVTPGGASHFWHRRNPDTDALEWFAYDRSEHRWRLSGESILDASRAVYLDE